MEERNLSLSYIASIRATYLNESFPIAPAGVKADVNYIDLKQLFTNGNGTGKCDLLHFSTRWLNNAVLTLNLDGGLTNVFGETLNYDAVKLIVIKNRITTVGAYIEARFKNERYYIGPDASRVLCEPQGMGLAAIVSSLSSEEGALTLATDTNVQFDLIIGGSFQESSSSSG